MEDKMISKGFAVFGLLLFNIHMGVADAKPVSFGAMESCVMSGGTSSYSQTKTTCCMKEKKTCVTCVNTYGSNGKITGVKDCIEYPYQPKIKNGDGGVYIKPGKLQ